MASVNFEIIENGTPYAVSNYSGQEISSLHDTLEQLVNIPNRYSKETKKWLEPFFYTTVHFLEDEFHGKITFNNMKTQKPINAPEEWLEKFLGKTNRIYPEQYGLSPWPDSVEIRFTQVSKIKIAA